MGDDQRGPLNTNRRQLLKLLGLGGLLPLGATGTVAQSEILADQSSVTTTFDSTALDDVLVVEEETSTLGPGAELTSFLHLDPEGWVAGELLEVALDAQEVSTELLSPGIPQLETVTNMVNEREAAGGINGDFFHGSTPAPLGAEIGDGQLRKPSEHLHGVRDTYTVSTSGRAHIVDVLLEGTVTLPSGDVELDSLNADSLPSGAIGAYTEAWGETSRRLAVGDDVTEVLVRDGEVVSISGAVDGVGVPAADEIVLVGTGESGSVFEDLDENDPVSVEYGATTDLDAELDHGIGGNVPLVTNGNKNTGLGDEAGSNPRTAIGVKDDGGSVLLLAVDGRQHRSRGLVYSRLIDYMVAFGAIDAINLDGGGSTTLVARERGREPSVQNNPSDGVERPVSNGIGIVFEEGTGELDGYELNALVDGANPPRVFPGLTRDFTAYGHDEMGDPVEESPASWSVSSVDLGSVDDDGTVTGETPGEFDLVAERDGITGERSVLVLDDLRWIETDPRQLELSGATDAATFTVGGRDAEGWRAPIAPRDVSITYDEDVLDVKATGNGGFEVSALVSEQTATIDVEVGGRSVELPVGIGATTTLLSDFSDPNEWELIVWPSEVDAEISFGEGRGGEVLSLDYDFTTTEETRAAYIAATDPFQLPDGAEEISLWVDGDGNGAWLRCVTEDAAGVEHVLDLAASVNWEGWEHVQAEIPDTAEHPVAVQRIYPVESAAENQYAGTLRFDDLTTKTLEASDPADSDVPVSNMPEDPLILQNDHLPEDPTLHFAALSGGALSADENGLADDLVRRALSEIVETDPDFVLICGNLVESGTTENLDAAMDVVNEELGTIPVYYLPGSRELKSDPNLENFKASVDESWTTFDQNGARIVLLNSAHGTLGEGGFDQLAAFDSKTSGVSEEADIDHVIVGSHRSVTDPFTIGTIVDDELEADFIRSRLSEVAMDSNTDVAYLSGSGDTVGVDRYDGVAHVSVGTLDGPIDPVRADGDARVWMDLAMDANGHLRAVVRPLLAGITVDVPENIEVDETVSISATGHQDDAEDVPLAYPLTVRWSGSENLFVGTGDERANARETGAYHAILDPEAGELEGLSTGQITVHVEANDVSAEVAVGIGDPTVNDYANEEEVIDTPGLRDAVDDWRSGDIDTALLREVVDYWRSGARIE